MRRLSSHLWVNRFGVYYVRLRLPRWLRRLAPEASSDVRRSLKTRNPGHAQVAALQLAAHWQKVIRELEDMAKKGVPPSQWLIKAHGITVEVERGPNDDPADLTHIVAGITQGAFATTAVADAISGGTSQPSVTPLKALKASRGPWLFDAIQEYGRDKVKSGNFSQDTWDKAVEPALRAFRELIAVETRTVQWEGQPIVVDDIRMSEITPQLVRAFKHDMLQLPSHTGQSNRVARRSNPFSASFKAALASGKTPSNARTVQKKLDFVATFLRWAVVADYLGSSEKLVGSLKIAAGDAESYKPFSPQDLKSIFERPEFAEPEQPWMYWVPLLALYTGARLGELAQLQASDFERRDGRIFVHFTDKNSSQHPAVASKVVKTLKTRNSQRVVPVHRALLDLGLLAHVDFMGAMSSDGFIFPELRPAQARRRGQAAGSVGTQEAWSKKATGPMNDMLRNVGVGTSREKVFHSFRATINAYADDAGLDNEQRSALLGHSAKSINEKHYLTKRSTRRLEEFMDQLDYGLSIRPYGAHMKAAKAILEVGDLLDEESANGPNQLTPKQ